MTPEQLAVVRRLIKAAEITSMGPHHDGYRDNYEWKGRSEYVWKELAEARKAAEKEFGKG